MATKQPRWNHSRAGSFPWRQAFMAAGVCSILITSCGWFDAETLGIAPALKPWWVLAVACASGVAGFVLVIGEWLVRSLRRRLGMPSTIDVELRSRF